MTACSRFYAPILADVVFYFSVSPETSSRRLASQRAPSFYESGQDVTGIADPLASYRTFVARMMREYENLALVFEFVTVDGERSIYDQHRSIRDAFLQGVRRRWAEWNVEAVAEWLRDVPGYSQVDHGA